MTERRSFEGFSSVTLSGVVVAPPVRLRRGSSEASLIQVGTSRSGGSLDVFVEVRDEVLLSGLGSTLREGTVVLVQGELSEGEKGVCVCVEGGMRGHSLRVVAAAGDAPASVPPAPSSEVRRPVPAAAAAARPAPSNPASRGVPTPRPAASGGRQSPAGFARPALAAVPSRGRESMLPADTTDSRHLSEQHGPEDYRPSRYDDPPPVDAPPIDEDSLRQMNAGADTYEEPAPKGGRARRDPHSAIPF